MRKFLVFIILIGILIVAGIWVINSQLSRDTTNVSAVTSDKFIVANGISWYQDPDKQFNLAIFKKAFTLSFTAENAQSLKEQSYLDEYSLAVNGTYFRGSYVESEHSGLLQILGKKYWDLIPDKQLTNVVIYDESADVLKVIPTSDFNDGDYSAGKYTLFQTGPLMIEDNVVQTQTIADSLNGEGRFLRTVLGFTDAGEKFVLITRVNSTLTELANNILKFPVFQGKKVTVINLDGGTSTSMYSKELDQFNYRENSRLPMVIGVK